MLANFFKAIWRHKIIGLLVIGAIAITAYFGYKNLKGNTSETRYVLAAAEKGTLITSLTGSGQVIAGRQIDIAPKVSGKILSLEIKNGQSVAEGDVIGRIDPKEAEKAVADAKMNLASGELALEKLKNSSGQPLSPGNLTEADYLDTSNAISSAFLDLSPTMDGLYDILHNSAYLWGDDGKAATAYGATAVADQIDAEKKYQAARTKYDENLRDYKNLNRGASWSALESVFNTTSSTLYSAAEAVKSAKIFTDYVVSKVNPDDRTAAMVNDKNSLVSYTTKINAQLANFLAVKNANRDTDLSFQTQKISTQKLENSLRDAQEDLEDYAIRAPWDGIIAQVSAQVGDSAAPGIAIATLLSKQMFAQIALNEVDAASVAAEQKATLTFDAIPDLSIAGVVSEIDTLGTVSQGVVTYNVKIALDTQDQRVKPNMSVSATIITAVKQNVLIAPSSAIKSSDNNNYVEILDPSLTGTSSAGVISKTPPRQQAVRIGLINDTAAEILSGLSEGDLMVVQTISEAASQNIQTQGQSLFQIPGNSRGAGGSRQFRD